MKDETLMCVCVSVCECVYAHLYIRILNRLPGCGNSKGWKTLPLNLPILLNGFTDTVIYSVFFFISFFLAILFCSSFSFIFFVRGTSQDFYNLPIKYLKAFPFKKCLLSTYYESNTVLSTGHGMGNKTITLKTRYWYWNKIIIK